MFEGASSRDQKNFNQTKIYDRYMLDMDKIIVKIDII